MTLPLPWDRAEKTLDAEYVRIGRDPECAEIARRPGDLQVLDADSVHVVDRMYVADPDREQTLTSYASPLDADKTYVLIDDTGGLAIARTTSTPLTVNCYDDCPTFWWPAVYVIPPRRSSWGAVSAIGPLPEAIEKMLRARGNVSRKARRYDRAPGATQGAAAIETGGWRAGAWFDLDGDGHADVVQRVRECGCMHFAVETLVHEWDGVDWRTTERYLHLPLPVTPDRCAESEEPR
jgi:hypothetical protein